jgi:hypothetical protein
VKVRYGWCQNAEKSDKLFESTYQAAKERYPWLKRFTDRSVTECRFSIHFVNSYTCTVEILYGALDFDNPKISLNDNRSFFYLRDPKLSPSSTESTESKAKLSNLKDRLRDSGLSVRENYQSVEKLGQQ